MPHHSFPEDLVQAQRDWYATYHELAAAGGAGSRTTVLRRRLVRLSVRISAHPFWATLPGSAPAARMALKELTWTAGPAAGDAGAHDAGAREAGAHDSAAQEAERPDPAPRDAGSPDAAPPS